MTMTTSEFESPDHPHDGEVRVVNRARLELSGQTFGNLVVLRRAPSRKGRTYWLCRCACGNEKEIIGKTLVSGLTKGCGCHALRWPKSDNPRYADPTYASWTSMKTRCSNPNRRESDCYVGRGITMCARWDDYLAFLEDMGPRPPGTSLDRIDVNGNYEPGNCRWADAVLQANNRRPQKRYRPRGFLRRHEAAEIKRLLAEGHPQKVIAERFGVSETSVSNINTGRTFKDVS